MVGLVGLQKDYGQEILAFIRIISKLYLSYWIKLMFEWYHVFPRSSTAGASL